MDKRQLVIDSIRKNALPVLPYQLDLTEEAKIRFNNNFNDPDFVKKIGNSMAIEKNESFTRLDRDRFQDSFGVIWINSFNEIEDCILKEPNLEEYNFPQPDEEYINEKCERLTQENPGLFKVYMLDFCLFERAWGLRGRNNLLLDLQNNPGFVEELLDRIVEHNLLVMSIVAKHEIDCIYFGDDWADDSSFPMGADFWRKFFKPRLARLYGAAKAYGLYVAHHSCGNILEIFPDLVEIGLDIFNTFQPEIYNVAAVKREFGQDLTFYGGISTRQLLATATPDKVRSEMQRLIKIIGEGGGYIIAPTHAVPGTVPVENILAFLGVVQNQ